MKKRKKNLLVQISHAELIDKIAILEIKAEKILHPEKNKNVRYELGILREAFDKHIRPSSELDGLIQRLQTVSRRGWDIEDQRRICERNKDFGPKFLKVARAAFKNNEERMIIWKEINFLLKSNIIQEKSYET